MGSAEMALSMEDARDLLYKLGVTSNYTDFFHTAYAISLCMERQERLILATKWLYPKWQNAMVPTGKRWNGISV